MNVVHEDVEKLVDKELETATERFGLHHSWHEKYAVIKEEFDEAQDELNEMLFDLKVMWKNVKRNDTDYSDDISEDMYNAAIRLACEAIQVAAMCKKEIENDA